MENSGREPLGAKHPLHEAHQTAQTAYIGAPLTERPTGPSEVADGAAVIRTHRLVPAAIGPAFAGPCAAFDSSHSVPDMIPPSNGLFGLRAAYGFNVKQIWSLPTHPNNVDAGRSPPGDAALPSGHRTVTYGMFPKRTPIAARLLPRASGHGRLGARYATPRL